MAKDKLPLVSIIILSMEPPSLDTALVSIARQTQPPSPVIITRTRGGLHADSPRSLPPPSATKPSHRQSCRFSAASRRIDQEPTR